MIIILLKFWREVIIAALLFMLILVSVFSDNLSNKLKKAEAQCKAQIAKIEQEQQKALIEQQNKANEVSASYEAERAEQQVRTQVVYKTVEKIVTKPVYRNVCIDADGLHEINSLIKANNPS